MTSLLRKRNQPTTTSRRQGSLFSLGTFGNDTGDSDINASKSQPRPALRVLLGIAALLLLSVTINVYLWLFVPRASLSTSEERECGFLLAQQNKKNATTVIPWEQSTTMPMWMKYYIFWHAKQRQALTPDNWNLQNQQFQGYYILHCLRRDDPKKMACGGASDRLQQVPYALKVAYDTNRLLFIKWEKPAPLEAFLEPPPGGLDWRLPKWLDEKLPWDDYYMYSAQQSSMFHWGQPPPQTQLLTGHVGPAGGMTQGAEEYDALKAPHEAPYHIMFHDCWQALFRPIPPIQAQIDAKLQQLNLHPGGYVSVHIRAKYLEDHSRATDFIQNAVQCGHQLRRDQPIFVASDSTDVLKEALCFYEQQQKDNNNNNQIAMRGADTTMASNQFPRFVVSRHGNCSRARRRDFQVSDPLHFDNGADFFCTSCADQHVARPEDYYDTFVELYLLASGGCVAAGRGGYGVWASRISSNASCLSFHAEQDPGSGSRYFSHAVTCSG